jgi:hypothetical protein
MALFILASFLAPRKIRRLLFVSNRRRYRCRSQKRRRIAHEAVQTSSSECLEKRVSEEGINSPPHASFRRIFHPVELRRATRSLLRRPFKYSRIERDKERSSGTQFRVAQAEWIDCLFIRHRHTGWHDATSFGKISVLCRLTVDLLLCHTLRRDCVEL